MKTKEIKKALKCCSDEHLYHCSDCPMEGVELQHTVCEAKLAKKTLDLINKQEEVIKKLKARRYIITPKKRSPVEEILIQRNSPFVIPQSDFEITPIPTKEEIQTETAKEILFDLFGYVGSAQQFVITNDDNKTLIDCDKLFDYMGKVANKYGVEVEQ